jgi:hypothetical protein
MGAVDGVLYIFSKKANSKLNGKKHNGHMEIDPQ